MAVENQSKDVTSKPLYSQIEDALRRQIEYGDLKVGCQIPTELELMEMFEVSRTTVRTAIANLVNDGLLCRAQGRGTFVVDTKQTTNESFRERCSQENMTVGVVIAGLSGYQPSTVIRGIDAAFRVDDFNLMLLSSNIDPDIEKENLERLLRANVRGIIIWPSGRREDAVRRIVETSKIVPVLLIDCFFRGIDLPYVVSDNYGGAYEAVEHLISDGFRRIGFVSTTSPNEPEIVSSICDRYRGYVMALENNGIEVDERLLFAHWRYSQGKSSFPEYVKRNHVDAALIENDNVLVQVVKVCQETGINIPGDLKIVGFDDSQVLSNLGFPVSSVRQRWYDMGLTAGRMMIKMIYGELDALDRQIVLPTKLVIRD